MSGSTQRTFDRRSLLAGSAAAAAMIGVSSVVALAQDTGQDTPASGQARKEKIAELGYYWRATSPSIQLGDTFTAVMTNRGQSELTIWPSVIIMDHTKHHNESVIDQEVTLPAGGQQTFTAVNEYGVANHFSTRMVASTGDRSVLGIDVQIVNAEGTQTAQYNELAFMINTADEMAAIREEKRKEGEGHHHMDMD